MSEAGKVGGEPNPQGGGRFTLSDLTAQKPTTLFDYHYEGRKFNPLPRGWRTTKEGFERLKEAGRLQVVGATLRYLQYLDDFPVSKLSNMWADTGIAGFV